jgi:type IV pilus assembly protein PilO
MKARENMLRNLDTFIERIEGLSRVQRILIYVGVFALVILVFGYLSYWPKYQNIGHLNAELNKLTADLTKSKKNAERLADLEKEFEAKQRDYQLVLRSLPEEKEISSLLASISQSGQDAGLEFLLFQPGPEVNKQFYAEIPVFIQVAGDYHNVAMFFDRVANLSRIVNIRDIEIAKDKSGKLTTACKAVTYKFVEAAPEAKPDSKPKQKKK